MPQPMKVPKEVAAEWMKALYFGATRLQQSGESAMVTEPLRQLMQYLSVTLKDELDAMQRIDQDFAKELTSRLPPPTPPQQDK